LVAAVEFQYQKSDHHLSSAFGGLKFCFVPRTRTPIGFPSGHSNPTSGRFRQRLDTGLQFDKVHEGRSTWRCSAAVGIAPLGAWMATLIACAAAAAIAGQLPD